MIYSTLFYIEIMNPYEPFISAINPIQKKEGYFLAYVCSDKHGDPIFKCSGCSSMSGTFAVKFPHNPNLFSHKFGCSFIGMTPKPSFKKIPVVPPIPPFCNR